MCEIAQLMCDFARFGQNRIKKIILSLLYD
jgi:hypothetical protein